MFLAWRLCACDDIESRIHVYRSAFKLSRQFIKVRELICGVNLLNICDVNLLNIYMVTQREFAYLQGK